MTASDTTGATIVRILGALLGTIITWLALAFASNNCWVPIYGFFAIFVVGPGAAVAVHHAPRTKRANRLLLLLFFLAPLAAAVFGHWLPTAPCNIDF